MKLLHAIAPTHARLIEAAASHISSPTDAPASAASLPEAAGSPSAASGPPDYAGEEHAPACPGSHSEDPDRILTVTLELDDGFFMRAVREQSIAFTLRELHGMLHNASNDFLASLEGKTLSQDDVYFLNARIEVRTFDGDTLGSPHLDLCVSGNIPFDPAKKEPLQSVLSMATNRLVLDFLAALKRQGITLR